MQAPTPSLRAGISSGFRRWRLWAAALLLLVAVEGLYRSTRAKGHPVAGAEWIWHSEELPRGPWPASFFAVRDFHLETAPERARLLIVADEEYRVTLNGRFLGGNRYWQGIPLDRFDVGGVLVPGVNRIAVQLRSERGGGGLLASLQRLDADGAAQTILQTDTSWSILPSLSLGEVRGWKPLREGPAPRSWGRAPVGRWGMPRIGPERQLPAVTGAPRKVPPETVEASPSTPADLLLDWGRPVTGYLHLELPSGSPRLGKVFYGDRAGFSPEESREVVVVAARREKRWKDARPLRFRYARIQGFADLSEAYVELADERELPQASSAAGPGFEAWAPPSVSPSDTAVRHAQENR